MEAESKEKNGVWDPMPELSITSPYVHFRDDSNPFTMGNIMPETTLTLCQSRLYPPVGDFGFGLMSLLQHIYHGQPYARVDFIPQSGILDLASESITE
jgi:hypothetical protein